MRIKRVRSTLAISKTTPINTPAALRGVRNLIVLSKMAGTLDPRLIEGVAQAIPEAQAAAGRPRSPGFWSMLKMAFSAETRRALVATFGCFDQWAKR